MKNSKSKYEKIYVELIVLCANDVIATSAAFDGEEDNFTDR